MIICQTPLRISFAGGGTDLREYYKRREGCVVSAAIDKYAFVILAQRYDRKIYINYSRKEIVDDVDEIQHELVREAMRLVGVAEGIEITMLSDIPSEGSGLASSSSFTVGLLNALHMYTGVQVSPGQLAREACEIEINRCGKPIGKQDQYIAAYGGLHAFWFRRDDRVDVERIHLSRRDAQRLASCTRLFYTGQTRKSANVLREQRSRTGSNLDVLDGIKELALRAREALLAGEYDVIGEVLAANWELKKRLASQITNAEIDRMYERAMSAGALGAKISGAGGGGFLTVYCPAEAHRRLSEAMEGYRELPISLEHDGSKIIFNYRRPSWS